MNEIVGIIESRQYFYGYISEDKVLVGTSRKDIVAEVTNSNIIIKRNIDKVALDELSELLPLLVWN